jgi:hypothetical protein
MMQPYGDFCLLTFTRAHRAKDKTISFLSSLTTRKKSPFCGSVNGLEALFSSLFLTRFFFMNLIPGTLTCWKTHSNVIRPPSCRFKILEMQCPTSRALRLVKFAYHNPANIRVCSQMPYFDGDNWPDILEDIIKFDFLNPVI